MFQGVRALLQSLNLISLALSVNNNFNGIATELLKSFSLALLQSFSAFVLKGVRVSSSPSDSCQPVCSLKSTSLHNCGFQNEEFNLISFVFKALRFQSIASNLSGFFKYVIKFIWIDEMALFESFQSFRTCFLCGSDLISLDWLSKNKSFPNLKISSFTRAHSFASIEETSRHVSCCVFQWSFKGKPFIHDDKPLGSLPFDSIVELDGNVSWIFSCCDSEWRWREKDWKRIKGKKLR